MALGLTTESGGGDYTDIIKFDARAGRMFRIDRSQDSGGQWQTDQVEITNGFSAIFDLDNIEVGWALFAAGVAPQFSMVELGQPLPAKPSDTHKQGFRIMLKLGKSSGGDLREFASCAKAVISSVDALHEAFLAGRKTNAGKLPVVSLTGSTAIVSEGKGQKSTNYSPIFEITKWVDRPAELGAVPAKEEPKAEPAKAAVAATVAAATTDDEF